MDLNFNNNHQDKGKNFSKLALTADSFQRAFQFQYRPDSPSETCYVKYVYCCQPVG